MPDDDPAEVAAARWHEERVRTDPDHEQFSSCWCCCWSCDPDSETGHANPYFIAAMTAMWRSLDIP
jgi:hypothetical protein